MSTRQVWESSLDTNFLWDGELREWDYCNKNASICNSPVKMEPA